MKKVYLSVVVLVMSSLMIFAQTQVKQVIIANGGAFETTEPFSDFVTVASYNPETNETVVFDTVKTQSVQCVVIDSSVAYLAAQDSLIAYDLDNLERLAIVKLDGVNQIKIYGNYVIVGRQYPATENFIKVLNKSDLLEVAAFTEISGDTYGIVVKDDNAYISVNGGWAGAEGKIAIIDLSQTPPAFVEEINLGVQAKGITNIYLQENTIFSVNPTPYYGTTGSFTSFNLETNQVTSTTINLTVGKGIDLIGTKLYAILNGNIGNFDILSHEIDTVVVADNNDTLGITAATYDKVNDYFYTNFSSWSSNGVGKVYNLSGEEVDTYEVGVSAEAVAIDYREGTSINSIVAQNVICATFPNPCVNLLTIKSINGIISKAEIFDITGKQISVCSNINAPEFRIDVRNLKTGAYFIRIQTNNGISTQKVLKQ